MIADLNLPSLGSFIHKAHTSGRNGVVALRVHPYGAMYPTAKCMDDRDEPVVFQGFESWKCLGLATLVCKARLRTRKRISIPGMPHRGLVEMLLGLAPCYALAEMFMVRCQDITDGGSLLDGKVYRIGRRMGARSAEIFLWDDNNRLA